MTKTRCNAFDIRFVKGKRNAYRLVYDTENNATLRLEKWNADELDYEEVTLPSLTLLMRHKSSLMSNATSLRDKGSTVSITPTKS